MTIIPTKEVYKLYFERDFLQNSESYYENEAQENINTLTSSEYLLLAEKRLNQERDRLNSYLDVSSESNLIGIVVKCYIVRNCKILIEMENSGLYYLLNTDKYQEIKRMYYLFLQSKESREIFNNAYSHFLEDHLEEIVNDNEQIKNRLQQIQNLINFLGKIQSIQNCLLTFDSDNNFHISKIIRETFEKKLHE